MDLQAGSHARARRQTPVRTSSRDETGEQEGGGGGGGLETEPILGVTTCSEERAAQTPPPPWRESHLLPVLL